MYQIKFQKCIFDFEDVCKEYHSRNKRHDHETGEDWPDEDRIDIIGQNGNNGEHYRNSIDDATPQEWDNLRKSN